ncbi:MAG: Dam family site-specific DNA-(adenine-N6)-methyltransferase [Alphaproteobacteria bacterium]|nr:Dam family site-specific DNA-(adenine-N6)-methyltransferase [Alphaproteobacteria bacterium]
MQPFIKWAGGKRWVFSDPAFSLPEFQGRYMEPFLGGGAVFFHLTPKRAVLSDTNPRLVETYRAIRDDWKKVEIQLKKFQRLHTKEFYYKERARQRHALHMRAAQFLYLNRTCFNGLYRENLKGHFNVPIGSKDRIIVEEESFEEISDALSGAEIVACDFSKTIGKAREGDLIFADPPYTTAHNHNGFLKYNQKIFSWDDQVRLRDELVSASKRGARVVLTNADHSSIHHLYNGIGHYSRLGRCSVMSGKSSHRGATTEALYTF